MHQLSSDLDEYLVVLFFPWSVADTGFEYDVHNRAVKTVNMSRLCSLSIFVVNTGSEYDVRNRAVKTVKFSSLCSLSIFVVNTGSENHIRIRTLKKVTLVLCFTLKPNLTTC